MTQTTQQAPADAELPAFPARRSDPFAEPPAYAEWRAECPVKKVRFPNGQEVWAITRHAEAREVLSTHDLEHMTADRFDPKFPALRAGVGGVSSDSNLLYMDEPRHGEVRRMLSAVFTHRKATAMREGIQESVDRTIDELLAGGAPTDFHKNFALVIPSLVICQLLGVDYDKHEFFQSITDKLLSRDTPPEEFRPLLEQLHAFLSNLVEESSKNPDDGNVIGHLLKNHESKGELTKHQITGLALLLVVAGHETTATTISMTLAQLLHTGQWADLVANPSLAPKFAEEAIRTQSIPDNTMLRLAKEDFEVSGQQIKAGDGVVVLMAAANHDPSVFPDPATLDPTRSNRNHVALGHGVHVCLGQNLARVELDTVFQTLARRMPDIQLDTTIDDIDWKHDGFVFGLRALPVTWGPASK